MSNGSPSISIALATFNGARFLSQQLQSIATQTLRPTEIVVVDDGSTDETLKVIQRFAARAPFPVRIFKNEFRLGYRHNFMRAAALCSGELISFCDQDDIWEADKLQRTAYAFCDHDVLLAYHNAQLIDGNGKAKGYVFSRSERSATLTHEELEPWRIVPGFSQIIRRSLLDHSALHRASLDMFNLEESMPHDQWFLFLASALGKTAYISDSLALYRQHDQNTSGWLPAKPVAFALHNIAFAHYYVKSSYRALLNRIDLLQQLKESLPVAHSVQIEDVIAHYRLCKKYVSRRYKLYNEKSFRVRLRLLLSMVRNRTYSHDKVKFGRGSFLLDTVIGVPVGHTLRPPVD